ncbi:hypothetical protein B0I35DRAFT_510423 [Stachybotrys elegans]|uniref:AAA+ ATPase domain-containing protein n=1 Tax=Stachybotrys elegans TaxID=80388 RepID=A0A8K0T0V4_9HYPO|nr:hypothetical protein B0I35DRAFT_510423 [Stachybotrys elegans]
MATPTVTTPTSERVDFLGFELVTGHKPAEGSECAIQTLYEGKPQCACCTNWVATYPEEVRAQIEEQPETKQKAIVVRMRRNHGKEGPVDGDIRPLVLDSVVVQSASLKATLGEVFAGYRGITASLKKLVFKAPFHPFHYRWQRLGHILERQKGEDPIAAGYTQILYDLLSSELGGTMAEIQDLTSNGVITYDKLWALFEPGEFVVLSKEVKPQMYIIDSSEYKRGSGEVQMVIKARYIDWNGQFLGYVSKELCIPKFGGTRSIAELQVCPVAFHPSKDRIISNSIERGRKFRDLCGVYHKSYSGNIVFDATRDRTVIRKADGRIMIDAELYLQEKSGMKPKLTPLDMGSEMPELQVSDNVHGNKAKDTSDSADMGHNMAEGRANGLDLTETELMLCSRYVLGYSLKLNRWVKFSVNGVHDVKWNDVAFSGLMLPEGYKELLLSFVEGPSTPSDSEEQKVAFDDIIEGKGLGTILLLSGNPGTGKTMTAEAIADHIRRPLFSINVGGLGQSALKVEKRLQTILTLTEKWNAILLFDECDVFMQKRTVDNPAHNEIVAVALRILEYYRGTLFMTTNRHDSIDRAFESRIHLTLNYPDLMPESKEQIWRQMAARAGRPELPTTLANEEFARLRELPLNGRQIKNTVKNAAMLAHRQGVAVEIRHIKTVLAASKLVDVADI